MRKVRILHLILILCSDVILTEVDPSETEINSDNCVEDLYTVPTRQRVSLFQEVGTSAGDGPNNI